MPHDRRYYSAFYRDGVAEAATGTTICAREGAKTKAEIENFLVVSVRLSVVLVGQFHFRLTDLRFVISRFSI